ncbi:GIY-YIG nuclease family protein [Candidatus Woesearchaeota archaeon]|nr:GIY-YIG nuclease family protein [Candidatus Woesearchaeota archaeon]
MKGIYCLLIKIRMDTSPKIGSLGKIRFEKGNYAYIGSGQKSLEKRIKRHISSKKKKHWHIDYLLASPYAEIMKVIFKEGAAKEEECRTAGLLALTENLVAGFGCSDCRCSSHLFKVNNLISVGCMNAAKGWSEWKQ